MSPRQRIEEIDRMLFDATVLALSARNQKGRRAADEKIMDARIKLEHLRQALP